MLAKGKHLSWGGVGMWKFFNESNICSQHDFLKYKYGHQY